MKLDELLVSLGLEVDKGSFELGTKMLEGVHHALEALAIFEGVKTLKEWVEHTAEAADAAVKMGVRLGTTAEVVQELGYVASLSDVSMGALSGSLNKLERRLDQVAQKGKGPAADALRRLGISAKELTDLPIDKKLERIADGFADLPDSVSKVPLAQQLGLGANMIPLLKDGGDGIRELREEARMLGLVVDENVAKQFEEWNDDITRVKGALTGLKNDAVVALLPILRELTTGLFAWIKANRELIKQRLEDILRALILVIKGLARAVATLYEWFEKFAPIIGHIVEAFGELVGGTTDLQEALTYAGLAVAAVWALANLPIILMIALVGAAVLVANSLWRAFQGKDSLVKDLYESFSKYLGETGVGRIILGLKASFVAVFDFIEAKVRWLVETGRWISKTLYEAVHGDTQAQADEAASGGNMFKLTEIRQRRLLGLPNPEAGIDRIVTDQGIQTRQAFDTGIDTRETADMDMAHIRKQYPGLFPPAFDTATSAASAPQVTVAAPQMKLEINIHGNTDDKTVEAIGTHVESFFGEYLRDAGIATGAQKGRLP